MRLLLLLVTCLTLVAQDRPWRDGLRSLPRRDAVTAEDVRNVERDLRRGALAFSRTTPETWEANRALLRGVITWLAAVDTMSRDLEMRAALGGAYGAISTLGWPGAFWGTMWRNTAEAPQPPARYTAEYAGAHFAPRTPELVQVPAAEQEVANELRSRYDLAAAKATVAAQGIESIARSLEAQGMQLNSVSAGALLRLQVHFDLAADAIRNHAWKDVPEDLARGEAETEKLLRMVGR